jgi:thioredoxin-related protein
MMTSKLLGSLAVIMAASFVIATADNQIATQKAESFTWLKYDEGLKLAAKNHKPLMVDFYTDWCGYCKKMDKMTYSDSTIAKYIREHFIPVKVNAESREALNLPSGSGTGISVAHSFNVTAYPNIWFLESNGQKINNMPGYAPPEKFIHVLRYIGDGVYKSQTFQDYYSKVSSVKN